MMPGPPVTEMRTQPNARTAILALGAPAYLAASASEKATAAGVPTDVYVVNGFPLDDDFLAGLASRYTRVLTIEDGLIGTPAPACRASPALAASYARERRRRRCITSASSIPPSLRRKRSSRSGSTSASARSTCWTPCSRNR